MIDDRWVEVTGSQFTHETEGLLYLKDRLPKHSPYRAWTNFEFRDGHGRWHEVDALVLGRGRLHLIELKYYSGRLRGNDTLWLRDGKRAEDSPLLLARRKAQYFASKLKDELRIWAQETKTVIPDEKLVIPFVQESVFLHHPNLVCELPESSAIGLYGLDEAASTSHLPGISELLLDQPHHGKVIGENQEKILVALLKRIGLVQRREREAGSWVIEDGALDEGPGWQDWRGYHKVAKQESVRIRFQVAAPGAAESEIRRNRKVAEHEFRVMSRLAHDGLLRPRDLIESDLGVGLVYDYSESTQRLDLWLAGQTKGVPLDQQLSIIRQLAEALDYAHRNKVVHRGLSPKAVWIRTSHGQPKVRIGDWQSSGLAADGQTRLNDDGVTRLLDRDTVPDMAEAWLTEAFEAPEGRWQPEAADRIRVDVFGLGALAYYILSGKKPAVSAMSLAERLSVQSGLDLSVDLPQVGADLRQSVLQATRPAPGERLSSVGGFLELLDQAERATGGTRHENTDPLEATPGTVLAGGRFDVVRRLGRGSTAVGLLVADVNDGGAERVLKVSLDAKAAQRLQDEAEVLRRLSGSRLVSLVDGPIDVDGRAALLLESAGPQTLGELLRERRRLSIDLLERFGVDLLEALVQLDKAGVDHRDIKPANLGVREHRGAKHLVLFDFSLSRASASAVNAGTPPYLDPFLGIGARQNFDSAAERYAAAVVLFEMATGHTPYYGDPMANPASVPDEATIVPAELDSSVAPALLPFFRRALARDASARHHTAAEMLELWRAAFTKETTTAPVDADELAAKAGLATPLGQAGLSARALSALEPWSVATVGDLLAVDPVRLNQLSGVADSTRREVKQRARQWRERLGSELRPQEPAGQAALPSARAIAEILEEGAGSKRAVQTRSMVRLLLGLSGELEPFATQGQLGAHLPTSITAAGTNQLLKKLQASWAANDRVLGILRDLETLVHARLKDLGGVATVTELSDALLAKTTIEGNRTESDRRIAAGLLRIVADRHRALKRAEADEYQLEQRRREGRVMLLASSAALLDVAELLGHEADALLAEIPGTSAIIPAERVARRLADVLAKAGIAAPELRDRSRLVRLAAGVSRTACASGADELHHRELPQAEALAVTLHGVGGLQRLSPREIAGRVRVRFPALAPLPDRPRLDELLRESGLALQFDPGSRLYYSPTVSGETTGLSSRLHTQHQSGQAPVVSDGAVTRRLRDSAEHRSYLTLGVRPKSVDPLVRVLTAQYNAQLVDVTSVLINEMKRLSVEKKVPAWQVLVRADAEPANTRAGQGLAAVVKLALPAVERAIASFAAADDEGAPRPVLLTEASPLARYGHADVLKRWSDLTVSRGQAVWLVVPQLAANQGPLLDGVPVQTSPNQFLRVDTAWVDDQAEALAAAAEGVAS